MSTKDQMVFTGTTYGYQKVKWQSVYVNKYRLPLCYGTLFKTVGCKVNDDELTRWPATSKHTLSWGYNGAHPELLAVTILGAYARVPYDLSPSLGISKLAALSHIFTCVNFGERCHPKEWKKIYDKHPYLGDDFIKKHYKAFTAEVIAKLPDNWTLTEADITAWVKKQEEKK